VAPLRKGELVGVLVLGERGEPNGPYGAEEREFAETLSVSAAASIDNGRIYEELQELNRKLSFKVYQLNSLFDITRELNRSPDVHRVRDVLITNAMGQVLTTKAILIHEGAVVAERGAPLGLMTARRSRPRAPLYRLWVMTEGCRRSPMRGFASGCPASAWRSSCRCDRGRAFTALCCWVPGRREWRSRKRTATSSDRSPPRRRRRSTISVCRASGSKNRKSKKRWRSPARSRGRSFPTARPSIAGWDLAGINIPCLTVGGDYFDYLERGEGKHWLVIADVSGKGTGPAILMASIQAALRALGGLGAISLQDLAERLNAIVYRSTELNRYVTAFFSCLDCSTGEMEFVNAGHCYPILMRRTGAVERLVEGGPVIGLFPELHVTSGRTTIEKGDLLVMYTDGLSETRSPEGEEFEDERILAALRGMIGRPSQEIVARLVAGVRVFAADAGLSDDLTLMVAQRV
jgi:hypothetical protein